MRAWVGWIAVMVLGGCSGGAGESADDPGAPDGADGFAVELDGSPDAERDAPDAREAGPDTALDLPADAPDTATPDAPTPTGPGVFVEGCPIPGRALARRIADPDARLEGPDAIGRDGDFLLASEKAAFVIESAEHRNAYFIYGGIPVDAVALDGCAQAGQERFQEVAFMMGVLRTDDFYQSVLRTFRAGRVEVVNDGSDGQAAVVRATGSDDRFWLIEDELIKEAVFAGQRRPLSDPLGVEITVDYVLEPGAAALRMDVTFRNLTSGWNSLLAGCQAIFGGTTRTTYYADGVLNMGLRLDLGVPWMQGAAQDGTWAFSMDGGTLAVARISGVQALIDADHVTLPMDLAPAGQAGDRKTARYVLAVGTAGGDSAVVATHAVNPQPVPGMTYTLQPVAGRVVDGASGEGLAGARVDVMARNPAGAWWVLDTFYSGDDGRFAGSLADFGDHGVALALAAHLDGRPDPARVDVTPGAVDPIEIAMDPGGEVCAELRDGDGSPLPGKVLLWRNGALLRRLYAGAGTTCAPVVPGSYDVSVTRGFEYTSWQGTVEVPPGGSARIERTLERVVDTAGWLSVDTHVHAGPSPDNVITIPDRIRTIAAEGLEVAVATDHEAVSDWSWAIPFTGLEAWVATVVGEEVTASLPEHMTGFPFLPDAANARGGPVPWYGLDLAELVDAIRARGAQVVGLNHPRGGGYLDVIDWQPVSAAPGLDDPTMLGLSGDAELWTWDLDQVEVMNGTRSPFRAGMGSFDDWTGFLNRGHRVTAVAVSDAHDWNEPGSPRTYFRSPTDDPAAFRPADLVDAVLAGRAVMSMGAFVDAVAAGMAGPGDTVTDADGSVDVAIRVQAPPEIDVAWIKVYRNCDQVAAVAATDRRGVVKYDGTVTVPLDRDAHLVVAAFGTDAMPRGFDQVDGLRVPRGMTNAIFVDADGNGAFDPPGGRTCVYDLDPPAGG